MRLSEERVFVIVGDMVERLLEAEAIAPPENENLLVQRIAGWLIDDLRTEDEIDREVRRILRSYSRPIDEDSEEWDILFRKTRLEQAERRGYIL